MVDGVSGPRRFNNVTADYQSNESSEKARIEQGEFPHPWLIPTGVDLHVASSSLVG